MENHNFQWVNPISMSHFQKLFWHNKRVLNLEGVTSRCVKTWQAKHGLCSWPKAARRLTSKTIQVLALGKSTDSHGYWEVSLDGPWLPWPNSKVFLEDSAGNHDGLRMFKVRGDFPSFGGFDDLGSPCFMVHLMFNNTACFIILPIIEPFMAIRHHSSSFIQVT